MQLRQPSGLINYPTHGNPSVQRAVAVVATSGAKIFSILSCKTQQSGIHGQAVEIQYPLLHTLGVAPLSAKFLHLWQGWKTDGPIPSGLWKASAAPKGSHIKPQQPSPTSIMGDAFFGLAA